MTPRKKEFLTRCDCRFLGRTAVTDDGDGDGDGDDNDKGDDLASTGNGETGDVADVVVGGGDGGDGGEGRVRVPNARG